MRSRTFIIYALIDPRDDSIRYIGLTEYPDIRLKQHTRGMQMSDRAGDGQDKYISISQAMSILNVRFERITWFIATGDLSSRPHPRDRSRKLVSFQDVHRLRNLLHLRTPWIIYALVDPRNDAVRYVGRAYEPQIRLREHINSEYAANPAKYRWIRELKKNGLLPRMEVLEGVYGSLQDADLRERHWIQYFVDAGAVLTNTQYIEK